MWRQDRKRVAKRAKGRFVGEHDNMALAGGAVLLRRLDDSLRKIAAHLSRCVQQDLDLGPLAHDELDGLDDVLG
jgi:hypothetical protein